MAATAVVAGQRHALDQAAADRPAATGVSTRTSPTVHREPVVSRGADRLGRAAARVTPAAPVRRKPLLPVAPATAGELVDAALSSDYNVPGHCLAWTREQAGVPSRYADATSAWEHASGRRPADTDPPRGAVVYWTGGSSGYGHIAISLGNGRVRSTDAGGAGEVATVKISRISSEWDLKYAGWSNSVNGYRIAGVAAV
jgi:hypothetical protein